MFTDKAPAALGPYSQAIKANGTLYVSGALGLDPASMEFVPGGVAEQAEQAMINLGAIIEAGGCSWKDVVKSTILLADMGDFGAVNEVYGKYFPEDPPARACFAVKTLPKDALVEIEMVVDCS